MDRPLVTVRMVTYNHDKYVEKAIRSVLAQKVNFDYEFLIADDASTDKTVEIIKKYEMNYPKVIKAFCRDKNLGINENTNRLNRECRGKYIAVIEGDDYWNYELKLQRQIDYLEAHDFAVGSAHNVLCVDKDGEQLKPELIDFPFKRCHKYRKGNAENCEEFGHLSSLVFRNFNDILTPKQIRMFEKSTLNDDFKMGITLGMVGYIYYFEEIWSCRRRIFVGTGWTATTVKKDLTKFVCSNYFKAQQYIQVSFGIHIKIADHIMYMLKNRFENRSNMVVLLISYLEALKRDNKNKHLCER